MGFHPTEVWQFWQGMLRLPCGLRETDPLDWLFPRGTSAPVASHMQAATSHTFASETLGAKFPAHLVSNREALGIPTAEPVPSSFIWGKLSWNRNFRLNSVSL
jgi:hypothetical protein